MFRRRLGFFMLGIAGMLVCHIGVQASSDNVNRGNSMHVLQINFKYNTTTPEFKRNMLSNAPRLAAVRGLRWKIWSFDETNREASGYYLFDSEATIDAYLNNVFFIGMGNNPTVSNIVVKKFEILEEPTAITRGPIDR
jgi:hypothetical protein